jgi:hypothetical protein
MDENDASAGLCCSCGCHAGWNHPGRAAGTRPAPGYTNEEVRGLIARGVEAAVADDRATATQWVFSVQAAPGNHPQTQIVATMRSGSAREVSGFFTSPNLGTAPTSLFVEEVRQFAKRLLRRSDIG